MSTNVEYGGVAELTAISSIYNFRMLIYYRNNYENPISI
jgi:hypothetical protein